MICQELQNAGTVALIGAGPAGATLARLLQLQNFNVTVFERDASSAARSQGGSLDLRPDSGQKAVDAAGLTEAFAALSRDEAKAFEMRDSQGSVQPGAGEETHEDAGPEIDRGDLRQLLLDSLAPGTIAWGHQVTHVQPSDGGRWKVEFADQAPVIADFVVGADGVRSRVRHQLTPVQPAYTGISMVAANIREDLWRGSPLDALLGEGSIMFADGKRTIFVQRCSHDLILLYYSLNVAENWPASDGFTLDNTQQVMDEVKTTYRDWSPEVMEMLTQVRDKFQLWPLSVMPPDYSWQTQAGLTMIGDSSHAMPPFTGKGVNLALLDALELAHALTENPNASLADAVQGFEKRMQARTKEEITACLAVGENMYDMTLDLRQWGTGGAAA